MILILQANSDNRLTSYPTPGKVFSAMDERQREGACSEDWHDAIKWDQGLWAKEVVPPVDHMSFPVVAWVRGDSFSLVGNCRRCHSTLYAPVEIRLRGHLDGDTV